MGDFNEISSEMNWYVAHTYLGYENRVKANLEKIIENRGLNNLITEIQIPVEIVTVKEKNPDGSMGEKQVEEKIFPSYVLIKMVMSDETWHVVRNITGVTGFVGPGSKPVPLTDEEAAAMGIATKPLSLDYGVGDSVKIFSGPLDGFYGVVESISPDLKKITVVVSMFGRETPVELDADNAIKNH